MLLWIVGSVEVKAPQIKIWIKLISELVWPQQTQCICFLICRNSHCITYLAVRLNLKRCWTSLCMCVISTGGCTAPETTSTPTCLHRSFCELFPSWSETLIWAETFLRSKTAGTSQMYSVIRLGHRKRGWLYFQNHNRIKINRLTALVLLFKCQVSVDWVPQSTSPICYDASTAKVNDFYIKYLQKFWKVRRKHLWWSI